MNPFPESAAMPAPWTKPVPPCDICGQPIGNICWVLFSGAFGDAPDLSDCRGCDKIGESCESGDMMRLIVTGTLDGKEVVAHPTCALATGVEAVKSHRG